VSNDPVSFKTLVAKALEVAASQVGVREKGRNRGPRVDKYIRAVKLDPEKGAHAWCVPLVQWCYIEGAEILDVPNPLPRTPRVLSAGPGLPGLWDSVPEWARSKEPTPGAIFCMTRKGGGHAGFVEDIIWPQWRIITIEGNSNPEGSPEGDGVYRRSRDLASIDLGFIDYGRLDVPTLEVA
jgi:hypothetical protein